MKKVLGALVALTMLAGFAWSVRYLYSKSRKPPAVYETEVPQRTDIVKKTVATGSVVPRREVTIKPQVSGIIEELFVEPGQAVQKGDAVAKIRIIPNLVTLNAAESRVKRAHLGLENARRELERHRELGRQGIVPDSTLQQYVLAHDTAREEVTAAQDNLDLIRKGATARAGTATNTVVRATAAGTVLEVPLEPGNSVIESNTFNDGTTIATIADMKELIFKGKVDESEVGKLRPGMAIELTIGAIEGQRFQATLEYIAPKGLSQEGAIQFEIRAALVPQGDTVIRANLSANADIVLARKEQVLAISESLLQFDDGKPFVEVEIGPQRFEKRPIETGLSDGIHVEVVSGLGPADRVKNAIRGPAS